MYSVEDLGDVQCCHGLWCLTVPLLLSTVNSAGALRSSLNYFNTSSVQHISPETGFRLAAHAFGERIQSVLERRRQSIVGVPLSVTEEGAGCGRMRSAAHPHRLQKALLYGSDTCAEDKQRSPKVFDGLLLIYSSSRSGRRLYLFIPPAVPLYPRILMKR